MSELPMSELPVSELPVLGLYADALVAGHPLRLRHEDGHVQEYDVGCWKRDADPVDLRLLDRCVGPTLDLGCGPGRLAAALAERALPALGVDVSGRAVTMARRRGASAIVRDLFAPLPGEGRWEYALLVDGNIGIGGEPRRLLRRIRDLLAPGGSLLAEVSALDVDRRGRARILAAGGGVSSPFGWADLGAPALIRLAASGGWVVLEQWDDTGRRFLRLRSLPGL
jgi:SAM-dependent methyltransferase